MKNRELFLKFVILFLGLSGLVAASHWIFYQAAEYARNSMPFESLRSPASAAQNAFFSQLVRPMGMIGIAGLCLLVEWIWIGARNSSFARLTQWKDPSVKTDWFCFVILSLLGVRAILAVIFSVGLTLGIQSLASDHFKWNLLSDFPIWAQLGFLVLLNPFLFYVNHRIMHAWFWEIHKVHHSATSMTILTPHRNHPIDFIVVTMINTIPAALLGCSFIAISIYEFFNGIYQSMVHSNLGWRSPFIDKYLLISPEAHRLHHSNNPEHFDTNFGVLVIWDKIFGTHRPPENYDEQIEIGFVEEGTHNTGNPVREIFPVAMAWVKSLRKHPEKA